MKGLRLPGEVLNVTTVTITENEKCEITNHKGIRTFSENEITVITKKGDIKIVGRALTIKQIDGENVLVEGVILGVTMS